MLWCCSICHETFKNSPNFAESIRKVCNLSTQQIVFGREKTLNNESLKINQRLSDNIITYKILQNSHATITRGSKITTLWNIANSFNYSQSPLSNRHCIFLNHSAILKKKYSDNFSSKTLLLSVATKTGLKEE